MLVRIQSLKDTIINAVQSALPDCTSSVKKSRLLHNILVWQETQKLAEAEEKKAWEEIQKIEKIVEEDDSMRGRGIGTHMILKSGSYVCMAKIGNGRKNFDLDAYITVIAKKYKLDAAELAKLAEDCKPQGKQTLTKFVIEA